MLLATVRSTTKSTSCWTDTFFCVFLLLWLVSGGTCILQLAVHKQKHVWEDKTPLESMYGKIKHTIRKHVWEDKTYHQKACMGR